jgi:molecular chaperone DnaJ
MAAKRDYYEVLGVDKKATEDEVKKAYRKLAKECHPDLHPDDKTAEQRFKEVNEANEVLSDPDKRARYDQFGHEAVNGNGGRGPGPGGFEGFGGFENIFDQLFGGGMGGAQRRTGPQQGADLRYEMHISFEESAAGCEKSFEFMRGEYCETCHGSGAKAGTSPKQCPTCKGTGQVRVGGGFMVTVRACQTCGGTGKIIADKCNTCSGTGRLRRRRTCDVKVPAGIDNGQTIVMNGQGEPGANNGPAGDLYIVVGVRPHKLFKRDGLNLFLDVPVSFTQAALGADIDVPTLSGAVKYHIPEGTQNDAEFRLKGHGMPQIRSTYKGDMIIRVLVEIPKRMSEKQKELLRQFDDASSGKEFENRRGFLDKVKSMFT